MEFGTRRAQEIDAALWGARAAYIGALILQVMLGRGNYLVYLCLVHMHMHLSKLMETNMLPSKNMLKDIKIVCSSVDTFHTLKSGVPNAIKVAKELGDKINFVGIRLDSGDIAYLSKEARRMLDEAGFTETKIIASNDLDEETITSLKAQGAKVDSWGVGTKLITGYDQPALGAVYKLVAIENERWFI
ncbi:hypothetical protein UM550_10230 [Staphylococcus aureus]|nr:hypothetical protein UM550_10230 [Staphylococcus aureus]